MEDKVKEARAQEGGGVMKKSVALGWEESERER